jgi:flagellar biosynthesis protein
MLRMVDIFDNEAAQEKDPAENSRRATAVALKKYGIDEGALPKVVAAGYGKLAEQIVEMAFKNGINVRQDRALAEILAAIELESEIPSEALIAVAEILAYVYKMNETYRPGEKDVRAET